MEATRKTGSFPLLAKARRIFLRAQKGQLPLVELVADDWAEACQVWSRGFLTQVFHGKAGWASLTVEARAVKLLNVFVPMVCAGCNCSDYVACRGGCSWSEPCQCSKCWLERMRAKKAKRKTPTT